ncbi:MULTISPECIES: membrane lipoprotein lipid attachment site-containing protein [unclassified Pseudomonas]|uniref:membrane lipoprotein lipid attachment site-containing protein n=1 Tax=unclassified Pseudomonas TaxID=196821 RepID=UPI000C2FE1F5|nr:MULTISPECIES: membrane lipoprotein lipid attachment site-containing protein [unclassified Pseudomonas]MCU1741663.1 membrane lipoprotein lipid attachment site-containing protein [Pseudomonas sp. 20S_6.2_Bac1]
MKKLLAVLFATLVLTGCANQKLTPEHRSQIKTVKILPATWNPKQMTYMGREQAWGMALGAGVGAGIGAAAGASNLTKAALGGAGFAAGLKAGDLASMSTVEAIIYQMETEKIDLGTLVTQGVIDQLAQNPSIRLVGEQDQADAVIQLKIDQWGFALTQGFSSVVYPTIAVLAQMTRGDEKVWQHVEVITAFNGANVYGYTPLEYRTEPEKLREALTGISKIVSRSLADDFKQ